MMWFAYIVKCSDDSLYTGITNNLSHRLKTHNKGKGSKYTRSRLPVELVYFKIVQDKSSALKEEIRIKKMKRDSKLALISE